MSEVVVAVTKKGQATIPKSMRQKHKIGNKALVIDTPRGVLVKPIPTPSMEKGSLKGTLGGKSSREIMNDVRHEESKREAKLLKRKA